MCCNGGFDQYFASKSADSYLAAIHGLMEMGATQSLRTVLRSRKIIFGTQSVPCTQDDRLDFFIAQVMSDAQSQEVKELDQRFREDSERLHERTTKFAEMHGLFNGC